MILIGQKIQALKSKMAFLKDETFQKFGRILPMWYVLMVRYGVSFKTAMLAIRAGHVRVCGDRFGADLSDLKFEKDAKGNCAVVTKQDLSKHFHFDGTLTNPDSMFLCSVPPSGFVCNDDVSCDVLERLSARGLRSGALTRKQKASLPPEVHGTVPERCPRLLLSNVKKLDVSKCQ